MAQPLDTGGQPDAAFLYKTGARHGVLWHIGTLDPAKKRRGSHEGNGLSVSLHPDAWLGIAHLEGHLYRLEKAGAIFADVHACLQSRPVMRSVWAWALQEGYVERRCIFRVSSYNCEDDEWIYAEFLERAPAEEEYRWQRVVSDEERCPPLPSSRRAVVG